MIHVGPIGSPCAFCAETALYRCDWRVLDYVPMRLRDLQLGDMVRRFNETKARRAATATVVELHDFETVHPQTYTRYFGRRVVLRIDGKTERFKEFKESAFAAIRIKRDEPCRQPVCEAHVQERGEDSHVCHTHWRSWEGKAT